ncbi:MAG: ABC transporter ATP-binding protein, partial [Patescibacteria group bacterium]
MAQEKLLALSLGYHERENTGQKIAKIEKGCNKMIEIMMNLFWHFLPQVSYLIINIILVLIIDLKLGLLFFLPFIPAIWLNLKCYNKFFDDWVKWDKHKEVSSGLICQSLMNVDTVQGFVQEEKEKNVFSSIRYAMRDLDKQISLKMQSYFFWMEMILHCCFILTIIAGIYFIYQGQSSIGTVIYIIATGNTSFNSIWELTHAYTQIMKNLVPVLRMRDLMNEKIEIKNSASAVIPDNFKGQFEFQNVCFGYSKKREKVFEDFNLTIWPNQMVALVGPSGEGKTTVARLICRTYEVNSGKILLDGYDIKDLDLFWYRRLFAIVHQDVQLFDTTIANNIRYGCKEASDEDVLRAIKASHLEITLD